MHTPGLLRTTVSVACLAFAACSRTERAPRADSAAVPHVDSATAATEGLRAARLAADSVGIISEGGEVLLSVAHDSVSMALSPERMAQIRRGMDTTAATPSVGGMIERKVKSSVQSLLSRRIMVPISEIESVRYEDGAIRFHYRSRQHGMTLESVKIDDRPALEAFTDADARVFVSAVQARLRLR